MAIAEKFTSIDLALMPDDGKRYEIIEGELYVSRQPGFEHQFICGQLFRFLQEWNERSNVGVALIAPGLIFAEDDDVAPDVVWISRLTSPASPPDHQDREGSFYLATVAETPSRRARASRSRSAMLSAVSA